MKRRSNFQGPQVHSWPVTTRAAAAAALVAAGPLLGWLVLALYVPQGGVL